MKITWKYLFSFDAAEEYYELKSEIFNLKVLHEEKPNFRTCLLVLLLLHDADNLASCVQSTFSFDITLDETKDPVEYITRIINEHFAPGDFGYMILASKEKPAKMDCLTKEASHEVNFFADLMKARLLKNRIVLFSK